MLFSETDIAFVLQQTRPIFQKIFLTDIYTEPTVFLVFNFDFSQTWNI